MRPTPTLRRRLVLSISLLVAASLVIATASLWGVARMNEDYGVAVKGYRQLREAYEVGLHVAEARDALTRDNDADARVAIAAAEDGLLTSHADEWLASPATDRLRADLRSAAAATSTDERRLAVQTALGRLAGLSSGVRLAIQSSHDQALRDRRVAMTFIIAAAAAALVAAIVVGIRLYRTVTQPVQHLSNATRAFAGGDLDRRVDFAAGTDAEFASLGRDFDHMAGELAVIRRDLESRVDARTRELVRAERLASVGYLAAGVAHEINNPLGIIAAYGERGLQLLSRENGAETAESLRRTLAIMCEEAFRGKEITTRLLELARPGGGARRHVSLSQLARESIDLVAALPQCAGVRFVFEQAETQAADVLVCESEIKQVILNLLFNAIEATGESGNVRIAIADDGNGDDVRLSVADEGRGMDVETLARAFEPFFSDKGHHRPRSTGLGLSVCHAIVRAHDGTMTAESEGIGRGSRLTVTLPRVAASKEISNARG